MLKRVFNFYFNYYLHVAISSSSLLLLTLIEFGENQLFKVDLLLIFIATFFIYNFLNTKKTINTLTLFSGIILMFLTIFFSWLILVQLLFLLLLSLSYNGFIINKLKLRNIPFLKIFLIAFVWSYSTVIIPILFREMPINFDVFLLLVQRFLFVLMITIPFDIRDLQKDNKNLKTIPQIIGINNAKLFMLILTIIIILIEYLFFRLTTPYFTVLISFITYTFIIDFQKNKYNTIIIVESVPIFILLIYYTNLMIF